MSVYPVLVRNQGHDYHDYTLLVADDVRVTLSQQQLVSLWKQIEADQKPLSDEDVAKLKADLAQIRADRLTSLINDRSRHDATAVQISPHSRLWGR